MRQFATVLILVALFLVLVGSRFKASDGDKLRTVSRLAVTKVRNAMPPAVNVIAPVDALRKELPTRPDDAVRARLAADKRFAGVEFKVTAEGGTVTLRGVVPNADVKRLAAGVARNTVGVDELIDELAVPAK
ncbi:MAG: BON domain-containing protein [Planctomycetes bacterium]|nr:BON domain-containing protein [Planctomycetota bacterium]